MKSIHVAIIHNAVIPAAHYGGTERVLWWLMHALTQLGHQVTLIAPRGSRCPCARVITYSPFQRSLAALVPDDVDIVHSTDFFREQTHKPLILTFNGNGYPGDTYHLNTVFVSKNHAQRHNSNIYVYNGINPEEYPAPRQAKKQPFCYFLAKARWRVKNVSGAIEVAQMAGLPIRIVGGWRPAFGNDIRWLGMTGGQRKLQTLESGSALIFPVRWHEPFGIALLEAMVTGSPIFGTPYGSLPELVTVEVGVLSDRKQVLADALREHAAFPVNTIRQYVLDNLTHLHMARRYVALYQRILDGETLNSAPPRALTTISPQTLLPWQ